MFVWVVEHWSDNEKWEDSLIGRWVFSTKEKADSFGWKLCKCWCYVKIYEVRVDDPSLMVDTKGFVRE